MYIIKKNDDEGKPSKLYSLTNKLYIPISYIYNLYILIGLSLK